MVLQMLSDKEEAEGGKQRVPITYLESKPLFWQLQFKIMCHSNIKYYRMLDFFFKLRPLHIYSGLGYEALIIIIFLGLSRVQRRECFVLIHV